MGFGVWLEGRRVVCIILEVVVLDMVMARNNMCVFVGHMNHASSLVRPNSRVPVDTCRTFVNGSCRFTTSKQRSNSSRSTNCT